jgi:hypothetical protein
VLAKVPLATFSAYILLMSATPRRCDPAGMESRMRKAISLAAHLIMIASNSVAQSQLARTVDITTACQSEDDFSRYATLLMDDVAAANVFRDDRSCIVFSAHTLVRIRVCNAYPLQSNQAGPYPRKGASENRGALFCC